MTGTDPLVCADCRLPMLPVLDQVPICPSCSVTAAVFGLTPAERHARIISKEMTDD